MTIRLVQPRILSTLAIAAILVIAPSAVAAASSAPRSVQLVIGFRAGATGAQMAAAESHVGATDLSTIPDLHARIVTVPAGAAAAALNGLRGQSDVAYAQADGLSTPFATPVAPNDPYFSGGIDGQEWGETVDQTNLAWSTTTGSPTVTIAIIDSGVDPTHPDLVPNLVPGWNVLTNSSNTTDVFGHGTNVSGVAVAASNNAQGVAGYCWSCRLMPIEVYSNANNAYASNIASGITWAVDHGAQIVNISLGSTSDSSVLDSAIAYAESHNVIVVAAAGNYGSNVPVYPAATPGVISVGATDEYDGLMSYSDFGPWVDVAAPSSQATTTESGGYLMVGGTSVAAPAVAGIIGLMLSADPSATPSQIRSALFTTTDPITGTNQIANGRVNAANAIATLLGTSLTTSAPTNSSPPVVSGAAQSGQTLTVSTGTWTESPTSYAYQWARCASSGCQPISGATSATYLAAAADVGDSLEASVTAANSAGDAIATSAPTSLVTALVIAPTNSSLPLVLGTAQSGQTLTSSTGTWADSPTFYAYQWLRCSSNGCSAISGATTATYLEGSVDVGSTLEVSVTASNSAGSGSATSAPTSIVAAASSGSGTGKPGKKK